ncbi:MAG TPA: hypothetical protein VD999_06110 [Vitreimonas sp.]|nr:hypothetical protein [Vitreimonas sp.]
MSLSIEWQPGLNDQDFFSNLTVKDVLSILNDGVKSRYYVETVLLDRENNKYRQGMSVNPETKLIFLAGYPGYSQDLTILTDFDGNKLRTKQHDPYFKAAERTEIEGTLSCYLDGKDNYTRAAVFSEVADLFYNLFHLKKTDQNYQSIYNSWIESFAKSLELSVHDVALVVAAKYHVRMFKNDSSSSYASEDEAIETVLQNCLGTKTEAEVKECLSRFLKGVEIFFNQIVPVRMQELGGHRYQQLVSEVYDVLISAFLAENK